MTSEPDAYPVAYCAPGGKLAAALTLMLKDEQVARIEEHPWLEGAEGVYIVVKEAADLTKLLPDRYEFPEPRAPRDPNWAYGVLVNMPWTPGSVV